MQAIGVTIAKLFDRRHRKVDRGLNHDRSTPRAFSC
jgi:hypothetical protein